jgi:hypothetical protein
MGRLERRPQRQPDRRFFAGFSPIGDVWPVPSHERTIDIPVSRGSKHNNFVAMPGGVT